MRCLIYQHLATWCLPALIATGETMRQRTTEADTALAPSPAEDQPA